VAVDRMPGELPKYPPTTSLAHLTERFAATLPYLEAASGPTARA
jgi:hypothetical protein